ncbi:MAG: hypothetical protein C0623_05625 [Desulfuromonas sp.]|nr:MAG: hypothetical protein C0623_05625 [Desulfuromonas sp.]
MVTSNARSTIEIKPKVPSPCRGEVYIVGNAACTSRTVSAIGIGSNAGDKGSVTGIGEITDNRRIVCCIYKIIICTGDITGAAGRLADRVKFCLGAGNIQRTVEVNRCAGERLTVVAGEGVGGWGASYGFINS